MIEQQIALVQCYIHHVKNKEVNISQPTNINQLMLLNKAFKVASDYFNK